MTTPPQPLPDVAELTGITRYPVKSCRREELTNALVEPWGLAGDRRWMLVDETGTTFTARECPSLVLVQPKLTEEGLLLTAPDQEPLRVTRPEGPLVDVSVWGSDFQAALASADAADWLGSVTGEKVRLVYLDDPRRRGVNPGPGVGEDVVSMADGYPLLLASEGSLAALNEWVAAGARAGDGPVPMTRFRPNLVVSGTAPWVEDSWRRVRIGDTTFRAVKACDRCVLTLVDPETGTTTKEPLYSLARHRRWDSKTWFGVNLIPDQGGGTLNIGDRVEVLSAVAELEPQR